MSQRHTWIKDCAGPDIYFPYRFFVGRGEDPVEPDCTELDVPDDYQHLPEKTYAVIKWAKEHGFGPILKLDDDVYVRPERLVVPEADYVGHAYGHPSYASGAAYWLSERSMDTCLNHWIRRSNAEDSCVGQTLEFKGIKLTEDPRYRVGWKSFPNEELENMFPHPSNDTITFHMYFPQFMLDMHLDWDTRKQYVTPPTGRITVL